MDIDVILKFAQEYEQALQQEEGALDDLFGYIALMESKFIEAREKIDDPVKRVVLTGMYNDWLNFKSEKWRDSIYMLMKGESFMAA